MISYILPVYRKSKAPQYAYGLFLHFFTFSIRGGSNQENPSYCVVPCIISSKHATTVNSHLQLLLNPKYYKPSQCSAPSISKHGQFTHTSFTKSNPIPFVLKYKVQVNLIYNILPKNYLT